MKGIIIEKLKVINNKKENRLIIILEHPLPMSTISNVICNSSSKH